MPSAATAIPTESQPITRSVLDSFSRLDLFRGVDFTAAVSSGSVDMGWLPPTRSMIAQFRLDGL